jgi:hypothetical protein
LFEPSVRATAWVDGGVAVWERPQIVVGVEPGEDRLRISLLDVRLRRREHLPEVLREREWTELVLGWTLATAATPHVPVFVGMRSRTGELQLRAEVGLAETWVLACEDVLGHRHVRRIVTRPRERV